MGIGFYGCRQVRVEGVRIESTGGDGIMLGGGNESPPLRGDHDPDCVCHDNHRQGISAVNAKKLLIENCIFSGTWGTPPEAGIDLVDLPEEQLSECVVRNCRFENNSGHEILIYLNRMSSKSQPVSIRLKTASLAWVNRGWRQAISKDPSMCGWSGMAIGTVHDNSPKGTIEFRNCIAENTGREGRRITTSPPAV